MLYCIFTLYILYACEKKEVPVVTTTEVTEITDITATCGGTIIDEGSSTIIARGVCWRTVTGPTTSDHITTDGTGTGAFTSALTGLDPGVTYYVRAYATNSTGTAYGDEVTFITPIINYNKYSLIIDRSYKIYRVTYSDDDSNDEINIEFTYSEDSIVKMETGSSELNTRRETIYYLSDLGLADSSKSCYYSDSQLMSVSKLYYSFDDNGYLNSVTRYKDGTPYIDTYTYTNGNLERITFAKEPSNFVEHIQYYYNDKPNLIDLDAFTGSWLGTLNKNLVESSYPFVPMSDIHMGGFKYEYLLRLDSLVEKRICMPSDPASHRKVVTTFEYNITN